nr:hypothetical protein [Tanacetum cinerariifolium]
MQSLIHQHLNQQTHLAKFPQIDFGLAVPVFKQGDDPIDAINKMMSFLSTVVTSRLPTTNNQLRNSSNPKQQATIHDGRVIWQDSVQSQREKRDATWFRKKVLLVKAQGNGKVLTKEELEFLADPARAVLMANLSSYGSYVLLEVPISDNTHNDMLNQSVQEMLYSEPSYFVEHSETEIHSDSNIIPYSQRESIYNVLKQSDPMVLDKKVNTKLIDYVELNRLSEDFGKHFVPQRELSNEQALHLLLTNLLLRLSKLRLLENFLSIKNNLRKLKGNDTVDNIAQMSSATTMASGMYKLDLIILAPRVKNNRETHEYYLKHTMEHAAILREVVEKLNHETL